MQFYSNWAKARIDEMDAALASLERKVDEVQADTRAKAKQILTDLHKKRDDFQSTVKKQSEASEAAWASAKAQLESKWTAFETEVKQYVESFGKQIGQQQATFKVQADAQLKAWRHAAEQLADAGKEFAAEQRKKIDETAKRMKAEADAAETKLHKLGEAGSQSWSALTAALTETRAAFDRANQAAREAFKRSAA
jgi:hypothetical protein